MFQICTLNLIYSICKPFHLLFHCFSTLVMFRFRNHLCQSYAILLYLAQVKTTVYALLKISSPHPKLSYLVRKKIVRIKVKTYTEDWKSQTIHFPSVCTLCCHVKVLMLLTALPSPAQLLQPSPGSVPEQQQTEMDGGGAQASSQQTPCTCLCGGIGNHTCMLISLGKQSNLFSILMYATNCWDS